MQTRHISGCWIHDVLCVAYLIDPSLITDSEYIVDVGLQGNYARGSSKRWRKNGLRLNIGIEPKIEYPINIIESVDNRRLVQLISDSLKNFK